MIDPITLGLGLTALGAASLLALRLAAWRQQRVLPPPPDPLKWFPPPPSPEELRREEERKRQAEEEQRRREEAAIEEVLGHVVFTTRDVQVGLERVGERVIGERREEVSYSADDTDVRPISDFGELGRRLPIERVRPLEMQLLRVLAGMAEVEVDIEHAPIMEPVYRPIFKRHHVVVYLLVDVSPSMDERPWRIRLAKGMAVRMAQRTVEASSIFLVRVFGGSVGHLWTAHDLDSLDNVQARITHQAAIDSTNITGAVDAAIADFGQSSYDEAELMIVSDGQDDSFDTAAVRKKLDAAKIRLHAVLLDQQNERLRRCADIYYQITEGPKVHPPVRRK